LPDLLKGFSSVPKLKLVKSTLHQNILNKNLSYSVLLDENIVMLAILQFVHHSLSKESAMRHEWSL
jgi:hypothetical protein